MDSLRQQRALTACKRFLVAMGALQADAEITQEWVWAVMPGLVSRKQAGIELPVAAAQLLPELGAGLGIPPGASTRTIAATFAALFGPCPHSNEVLLEACDYLRSQANGGFGMMSSAPKKPKVVF